MRKGFLYILLAKIFWSVSAFALHVGLGRIMGPEDYGVFGVMMTVISMNYLILGNGVRQAVSKYAAEDPKRAGTIQRQGMRIQLAFSFLLGGALALLAAPISSALQDDSLVGLFRLSALAVPPTGMLFVYSGALEGMRSFGRSAVVGLISAVSRFLFVFALVLLGFHVAGAMVGVILSVSLACMTGYLFCRDLPMDGGFDGGRLIRFALPVLLFSVALAALMHIDILFAKAIVTDDDAIGHYTAAQAVSRMLYFFFSTFGILLLPTVTDRIARRDSVGVRIYIKDALRYTLISLAPAVALISGTSGELMTLLYGLPYIDAARPLAILALGIACLSATLVLSTLLQAADSPRLPFLILTGLVILDVALLLILIPRYGLSGAASATAIAGMAGLGISGFAVYKRFRVLMARMSALRIALASTGVFVLSATVHVRPGFLPFYCLILLAGYVLALLAAREIRRQDVQFLTDLVGMIRKRVDLSSIPNRGV